MKKIKLEQFFRSGRDQSLGPDEILSSLFQGWFLINVLLRMLNLISRRLFLLQGRDNLIQSILASIFIYFVCIYDAWSFTTIEFS